MNTRTPSIFDPLIGVPRTETTFGHCWTTTPSMQRVIQRTASARKQALRRTNKAQERQELMDRVGIRRSRKEFGLALSGQFQAARKNRWEDWEKGPVAPMRDSGLERTTYGGQGSAILHPPHLPKHEQRRHVLFAEGDRVCVVRGRDQGQINVIQQVNRESETVLIKDINMVRLAQISCSSSIPVTTACRLPLIV